MRTITAPERTVLRGNFKTYLKTEILNPDLSWTDMSMWTEGFSWQWGVDDAVVEGVLTLHRSHDNVSLSPLIETSPFNIKADLSYAPLLHPGRLIRVSTASIPHTQASPLAGDWRMVYYGRIYRVIWHANPVQVLCHDIVTQLGRRAIRTTKDYSDSTGIPLETALQQIIDDNGALLTLDVPVSPGFNIKTFRVEDGYLLQTIRDLALHTVGWDIRGRWSDASTYVLSLLEPPRAKVTPDDSFGPSEYINVTNLNIDDADVRNYIEGAYIDAVNGLTKRFVSNPTSIAELGEFYLRLREEVGSNINTQAEFDALLLHVLSDLEIPSAEQEIETLYFWPVEIGDLYTFEANGVHYDQNHDWAVVRIAHRVTGQGAGRTFLTTRGKPQGAYKRWLSVGSGVPADVPTSGIPDFEILEVSAEGTADGGQPYGMVHIRMRLGTNVKRIRIHSVSGPAGNLPTPSQDTASEAVYFVRPEGDVPQAIDFITLYSIRTETGQFRKVVLIPENDAGLEGPPQVVEAQAVDSGTGPTGDPTGITVEANGTTMEVRGTITDAASEHLFYRNNICVFIEPAGGSCSFDDTGLVTSADYAYDVVAFRNGQTGGAPTTPPPIGGGGSTQATAPVWASGRPLGGVDGSGNPRVAFRWTGDALYLASVDIEESPNGSTWSTMLAAQPVNPAVDIEDFTYPNGTDRLFRLKGNPINPADPVKYSTTKHARYGNSTLP